MIRCNTTPHLFCVKLVETYLRFWPGCCMAGWQLCFLGERRKRVYPQDSIEQVTWYFGVFFVGKRVWNLFPAQNNQPQTPGTWLCKFTEQSEAVGKVRYKNATINTPRWCLCEISRQPYTLSSQATTCHFS